ncbi:helix-turn-helix transcriptional regulator [Maricaulis maris]|uniref:helix-turn-helix transcriptional regulator n=1 Tax=Maricaulis maris TaxID=74318 RepID=UPI001F3B28A9|nr:LuxR C-terminal-related transcriptional regulator [Maricaulis maris]
MTDPAAIRGLWRPVLFYAAALALGAFALEWLQYRFWARMIPLEIMIGLIGAAFAALGVWVGMRLTRRAPPAPFVRNEAALKSLAITPRELDVLEALVSGDSNKELARTLGVSPNTVKTHIARLFDKLGVTSRIQAIETGRDLRLIPAAGDTPTPTTRSDG